MKKKVTLQNEACTLQKSSAKVITMKSSPFKNIVLAEAAVTPTLSDIMKMQEMKMDDTPGKNKPIVLSDTWYEFSEFRSMFNLSPGTAHKWLANGWFPFSELGKLRFLNKADIENTMLRFRRYGLSFIGWVVSFSGEWEGLGLSFEF